MFGIILMLPLLCHAQPSINALDFKGKGTCEVLAGKVAVLIVPVGPAFGHWNGEHLIKFKHQTDAACRLLENAASKNGVALDLFAISNYKMSFEIQMKDTCPSLGKILNHGFSQDSLSLYISQGVLPMGFDQVVVLYVVFCEGRAFARPVTTNRFGQYFESIWYAYPFSEMDNPDEHAAAIAHEILHLFGAMDFYHLKSVPPTIKATIARSIMLMPADVPFEEWEVDPITQYLIGWRKKPEKGWKAIFKQPNVELLAY